MDELSQSFLLIFKVKPVIGEKPFIIFESALWNNLVGSICYLIISNTVLMTILILYDGTCFGQVIRGLVSHHWISWWGFFCVLNDNKHLNFHTRSCSSAVSGVVEHLLTIRLSWSRMFAFGLRSLSISWVRWFRDNLWCLSSTRFSCNRNRQTLFCLESVFLLWKVIIAPW